MSRNPWLLSGETESRWNWRKVKMRWCWAAVVVGGNGEVDSFIQVCSSSVMTEVWGRARKKEESTSQFSFSAVTRDFESPFDNPEDNNGEVKAANNRGGSFLKQRIGHLFLHVWLFPATHSTASVSGQPEPEPESNMSRRARRCKVQSNTN